MKKAVVFLALLALLAGGAFAATFYSWGIAVTATGAATASTDGRIIITGVSFTSAAGTAEFLLYDGTGATAATGTFVAGVNITAANTYANASFSDGLPIQNGLYVVVNPSGTGAVHFKR